MDKAILIHDCWNQIGVWATGVNERCPKLAQVTHCQNCEVYSNSGRQLLDRPIPSGYKEEWSEFFRKEKAQRLDQFVSMLAFRLGDEWYAIHTGICREITEMRPIHPIPHRKHRVLRGLVNVRGELLLCIALGHLFGLSRGDATKVRDQKIKQRLIVIEQDEESYVFPVSEVLGVQHFNEDDIGSAPSTLKKTSSTYITGIINRENLQIGCIDKDLLFHSLGRKLT